MEVNFLNDIFGEISPFKSQHLLCWNFNLLYLDYFVFNLLYLDYFVTFSFRIPVFSLEKKGILISCQSRSVIRPSVRAYVRPSVTFLVNVSPPRP